MKFSGWVMSAGLVLIATAANAQMSAPDRVGRSPYAAVSDVDGPYVGGGGRYSGGPYNGGPYGGGPYTGGPYAAAPPETPGPRYGGPMLLPPQEVYTILRENGFSPLGIPHQRGFVYTIAVVDRGGTDGRLVIDARNGRILRFMPAYRMGDNFSEDATVSHGPAGGARVASHTPPAVPMPKASPLHAGAGPKPAAPLAAAPAPAPAQQSAAVVQAKPADAPAPVAGPAIVEAKPAAPAIQPTQEMPKAQGLD
jgi:hypothetical protein